MRRELFRYAFAVLLAALLFPLAPAIAAKPAFAGAPVLRAPVRVAVWLHDDESNKASRIGSAHVDAQGKIFLDRADRHHRDKLREIFNEANEMDIVRVDAVPPADAKRFAHYSQTVERKDPMFVDALAGYLRTYHDIELRKR